MSESTAQSRIEALVPLRASPLWQAVFKLDWADDQFVDALNIVQDYISNGGTGVREESDANGHRYVLYAERLPKHVPILIGSGIHALRSSLDAAVSTLIEGVSKKRLDRVGFPFAETEQSLRLSFEPSRSLCGKCGHPHEQKPRQKRILDYVPELKDVLLEDLKPWKEGNFPLWALNKLDNYQKHRSLLLVITATSAAMDYFTPEGVHAFANLWRVHPGQEFVIAESRTMVIARSKPSIEVTPALPEDLPYGGDPLFEVLGTLYRSTHSALITLYEKFKGHEALS